MNSGFITQLEPPVLPVSLEKTESLAVIKNESPEFEKNMENAIGDILDNPSKEIVPDIKDIDIVYHPLCEDSIKSENVPTNILESNHWESVETQVDMKTEKASFVKTEYVTEIENINEIEDTSDGNDQELDQEVVKVRGNLETDEQYLNLSNDLNGISIRSRKPEYPEKTDFAEHYRTCETTPSEVVEEKIKTLEVPVIPVTSHEYITLANDEHVCSHCLYACNRLSILKLHIRKMHREIATMYQCPYCPYRLKWGVRGHIIQKHKDTKDFQWFLYRCDKCSYKTNRNDSLKSHKMTHLKLEEIQYFHCYHCSYKCKHKVSLKIHIFSHHCKNVEIKQNRKRYRCDQCNYKTYQNRHLKRHKLVHLKAEEIQYFYCYHCSYKSKHKMDLKRHIFTHHAEIKHNSKCDETKNKHQLEKRYRYCDMCDYKTLIGRSLNRHKIIHLKPEEIQYFYCYHCSHKNKHKQELKKHIFRHFKNEDVPFHCYICDFMTLKRESIIAHIKKHSKVQIKFEINEGS